MTRPTILCVSSDPTSRAALTRSLSNGSDGVDIARGGTEAVDRLERESIDAVVIDASTITNVPKLVDAVTARAPETPTFVAWSGGEEGADDGSAPVLSEVTTGEIGSDAALADAITRLEADSSRDSDPLLDSIGTDGPSSDDDGFNWPATDDGDGLATDLESVVAAVRRRLVDVTSPVAVERILREEFTATDRFPVAWVGEYDYGEREVVPWLTAPGDMEWPMQRTFAVGDDEQSILGRAIRSRTLRTTQYVADDADAVPFGDHAADRGLRAVAVAPLYSSDDVYGVFVVYASERFTEVERTAIRSAAEVASHVLETIAIRGQLDQQERALQRYERLVETAGDGMYVLDEQGHFMTVNDALTEMTGYSREGLLGEHVSIVFDEAAADAERETVRALRSGGGRTDTLELDLEPKTGDSIPCEAQIAVLRHDDEYAGSVGVVRDITERKRSERQLRERNERLDAFARIVSHDLRNPLGVAQGYLDLMEDTGSLDHVDDVRDGLDRMETIVEDVLAIARDGEWATDLAPVDLESVARDAWGYVSTADATLSVTGTTTLEADRDRLLRLLENLFRNAVEHGGTDVTVRVGLLESASGTGTETDADPRGFVVEDDGPGIPDELRENLFDPSVSTADGLGIGLWVVREVATGHGWTAAATESENGGARFEFELEPVDAG